MITALLIAIITIGVIYWFVSMLPLPATVKRTAQIICAGMLVLWVLRIVGLLEW